MKTETEKSLEAPGKVPRIVQVMYFKEAPRSSASQQAEQSLPQMWEAQWQQFLKTAQHSHAGWGNVQLAEAMPWDDTKAFLAAFEQVAEVCRWPREEWVGHLLPGLRGGMEQVYCRLDPRERGDYGKVKAALLRGDLMRTESKRQHFRQCCYQEFEGPRRIYGHLQDLCRQWLKPEHRTKEQILELIIQEQLLAMLPPEIQSWVRECAPEDCVEVVALAEDFLMGRQAAKMSKWPVPLQQMTVNSLEAEGPLAGTAARQHYAGMCQSHEANERMSTRNASFMLPPERREMPGSGLTEGLANLRDRSVALERGGWTIVNLDQKPLHWQVAQRNFGNANSSELLVPTPDVPQPDQERGVFYITETGETVPAFLPESRILGEIKIESYEDADSEAGDSFETVLTSPETGEESPKRKLRPREPPGGKLHGSVPQRSSMQLRKKRGAPANPPKEMDKKHQCAVCGHSTRFLSELLRHMKTHNGKRPYRCPDCGRTFLKLTSFEAHQRMHLPARRLKPGRKPLGHPGKGSHASTMRGKRMSTPPALARSMNIHAGGGPHTCQECGKAFIWISSLFRHWRIGGCPRNRTRQVKHRAVKEIGRHTHQERTESKYGLATLLGKSSDTLSRAPRACKANPAYSRLRPRKPQAEVLEVSDVKSPDLRKYVCPECGRRCARESVLAQHMRIHTGEKPYECPKCGRAFRWSSNFFAHRRKCCAKRPAPGIPSNTHPGEGQLCQVKQEEIKTEDEFGGWPEGAPGAISPEGYEVRSTLTMQPSELPGEGQEEPSVARAGGYRRKKKHACLECGRKFLRLSDMLNHTKVHTGVKTYECDDCGKTFQWASHLSEHLKSHTGDRKDPAPNPVLAECDVILEDEEELIHILERNFQTTGTKSEDLPGESSDAASENTEYRRIGATPKVRPRMRAGVRQGVLAQRLKRAAKKSKYRQKERKHECNICGHRTYYLSDLLRHINIHRREKPFKCLECGKAYTQKSALLFHQRSHLAAGGSSGRKSLAKGIAARRGERNPRGRKRTHPLAGLVKPMRSRTEEKPFECKECGQTFRWGSNLSRHRKLHRADGTTDAGSSKPNKMVVENSPQVRATLKRMGGTSAEITRGVASVTVVINDRGWKSKNQPSKKLAEGNLKAKEAAAQAGKFLYSKNGAAYRYKSGLVAHQKTPNKTLPQCDVCKRFFSTKCRLVDHKNTHTGAKPYKCEECGRCFAWKDQWRRHQKRHTAVKPYHCPECEESFFGKDTLMTHLQSHGSSCAYKCLQCGRKFSDRDQLFRHQRSHEGRQPYECEVCGQGFGRRDYWIKHEQQHTGGSKTSEQRPE